MLQRDCAAPRPNTLHLTTLCAYFLLSAITVMEILTREDPYPGVLGHEVAIAIAKVSRPRHDTHTESSAVPISTCTTFIVCCFSVAHHAPLQQTLEPLNSAPSFTPKPLLDLLKQCTAWSADARPDFDTICTALAGLTVDDSIRLPAS